MLCGARKIPPLQNNANHMAYTTHPCQQLGSPHPQPYLLAGNQMRFSFLSIINLPWTDVTSWFMANRKSSPQAHNSLHSPCLRPPPVFAFSLLVRHPVRIALAAAVSANED